MPARRRSSPWAALGLLALLLGAAGTWWLLSGEPAAPPTIPAPRHPPSTPDPAPRELPPPPEPRETPDPEPAPVRAGSLAGRLVDGDRRPVPRARVVLLRGQPSPLGGVRDPLPLAISAEVGADGRFTLAEVPAVDDLLIRASGPTFVTTYSGPWAVQTGEHTALGDILVDPGLTIVGTVLDGDGRLLPGARVVLGGSDGDDGDQVVLSDEEGQFELERAPRGLFQLFVSAPGHANAMVPGGSLKDDGSTRAEVTVRLERAAVLRGLVRARDTGEPLAGIEVLAHPRGGGVAGSRATTDAEGRFTLSQVARRAYQIEADGEGWLPERQEVGEGDFEEDLLLELRPAGVFAGRVVDPQGRPVSHYDAALRHGPRQRALSATGRTQRVRDAEGRFTFDDLDAGWYALEIWSQGYALTESAPVQVKAGRQVMGVEVTLQPGARLLGSVVTDEGEPVSGARVSLHLNNTSPVAFLRNSQGAKAWGKEVRTAQDGRFAMEDVTERVYQVEVDHPDFPVLRRNDVAVGAGEELQLEPFVLVRPAVVKGVALDGAGQPAPRVTVAIWPERGFSQRVKTDGEGGFLFVRLTPGTYHLLAEGSRQGATDSLSAAIKRIARFKQDGQRGTAQVTVGPGEVASVVVRMD